MLVLARGRLCMKLSREQETCKIGSACALDPALRRGSQLRWEEPPFKFSGNSATRQLQGQGGNQGPGGLIRAQ